MSNNNKTFFFVHDSNKYLLDRYLLKLYEIFALSFILKNEQKKISANFFRQVAS